MWWIKYYLTNTQKVSDAREAPEFLDPHYDHKYVYQVERMSLKRLKKDLNDVSMI